MVPKGAPALKHLIRALLAALALITSLPGHAQPAVTLGVFALRPEPLVQAMWQPFADYLGAGLGREVRLRVLDADAMQGAIARNELDLVLTNPTHLVELRTLSPLSGAIATQLDLQAGQAVSQFGGVILVRRDTAGLRDITDLPGKRVATTRANFLGTYPAQARELKLAGVDPAALQLKPIGQDQDGVVEALLNGTVDAAFVRTGLLEQLAREGRDLSMLRVLNPQTTPDYPYQRSNRFFPNGRWSRLPTPTRASCARSPRSCWRCPRTTPPHAPRASRASPSRPTTRWSSSSCASCGCRPSTRPRR